MVNCNPETVSTDYDTSDRLYFEPLTAEDVLAVVEREQPDRRGRAVRRPDAAQARAPAGRRAACRSSAPSPAAIDLAEDRQRFGDLLARARPARAGVGDRGRRRARRSAAAERIGYPVLVRPSYVLGGRAMRVCYDRGRGARGAGRAEHARRPLRRGRDRDRRRRGRRRRDVLVGAVMQHVEEAGVHSGDSACVIPPLSIGPELEAEIRRQTELLARGLGVQRAGQRPVRAARGHGLRPRGEPAGEPHRAVREKAIGHRPRRPGLPRGRRTTPRRARRAWSPSRTPSPSRRSCCRSSASPAPTRCSAPRCARPARSWRSRPTSPRPSRRPARAAGSRCRRGRTAHRGAPSCRSATATSPAATLLAQRLARSRLRRSARRRARPGRSSSSASPVTAWRRSATRAAAETVVDLMRDGRVDLIVNTPVGRGARADGYQIRRAAISAPASPASRRMAGASAAVQAIGRAWEVEPKSLQELHA